VYAAAMSVAVITVVVLGLAFLVEVAWLARC
jgi:hypothetical protein